MGTNRHRFTVYDALDAKGLFEANPANPGSRDQLTGDSLYEGPVEYPKMLYHPTGDTREISPGEWVETARGPKLVGQQFELIHQIVSNKTQERELLAAGWHAHPALAIVAGGGEAPPMGAAARIAQLESVQFDAAAAAQREKDLLDRIAALEAGAKPAGGPDELDDLIGLSPVPTRVVRAK